MRKGCAPRNPEATANARGDMEGEGRVALHSTVSQGAGGGRSVQSAPAPSPREALRC